MVILGNYATSGSMSFAVCPLGKKFVWTYEWVSQWLKAMICGVGGVRSVPLLLTLRRLMSYIYIYIYGAPILDVSRSHTTTQHSR